MECCIGIIIIAAVTVGGIWGYAYFATAAANRQRIAWAKTVEKSSITELQRMADDLEAKEIALRRELEKERLLRSNFKPPTNTNVELGEIGQRIKILKLFIAEKNEGS